MTEGLCQACGFTMGRGEWQAYDLATGASLGHFPCWGKPLGVRGVEADVWACDCATGTVVAQGVVAFVHRPCRARRICAVSRAVDAGRFQDLVGHELVVLRLPDPDASRGDQEAAGR